MTHRRPVIHQVVVGASEGDAITQMALNLRDGLRATCDSEVYAYWRHGNAMQRECLALERIPDSSDVDVLIYHLSIGLDKVHDFMMSRTEKLVLSYHNITPARFYEDTNPEFAEYLRLGREELHLLRDRVVLAFADSEFNAGELREIGYQDISVVPAGLDPARLASLDFDVALVGQLKRRFPNGYAVAVGQILPHKRVDQLMTTMHLLNSTHWGNVGLVVCGAARQAGYWSSILRFQQRTAMVDVHFPGAVSDKQLATYVRCASVFIGMSDHEGFCIPPVEAASLGVPVVVKGAAAVPETIGDGALVLPADASPVIAAEAVHEVMHNPETRIRLIGRGHQRVRELQQRDHVGATIERLMQVVS